MGDHDSLFKRAFSVPAHAAGEVRSILPAGIAEHLDFAAMALVPASFVDPELSHRHADLLFQAPLGGRPSYVYFLFEHQSEPDDLMPWRVLSYQQRIWAAIVRDEPKRKTLPPIITIVVHHGEKVWMAPRSFHAIVDGLERFPELARFVPDFDLLVDDLNLVNDAALQRRPLAEFPKIALWLLRDGRSLDMFLEHLVAWAAELEGLARNDPTREDYSVVLRYIWRVVGEGPYEIVRQRIVEVAPAFGEAMPSVEEQLIQRGIEKGRREGVRDTLMRLLCARFGAVDTVVESRIRKASAEELDRWIERVIVAERIDDVFLD